MALPQIMGLKPDDIQQLQWLRTPSVIIEMRGPTAVAVDSYGRVLASSSTDHSLVFNSVIKSGQSIYVRRGSYVLRSPIMINNVDNVALVFEKGAVLVNEQNDYAIKITCPNREHKYISLHEPQILGNFNAYPRSKGILVDRASSVRIYEPFIKGVYEGIRFRGNNTNVVRDGYISGCGKTATGSAGIVLENVKEDDTANEMLFSKLHIEFFEKGIFQPFVAGKSERISVVDCFLFQLKYAVYITSTEIWTVERCYFELDDYGVYIDNDGRYVPSAVKIRKNFYALPSGAFNVYSKNHCWLLDLDETVFMGAGGRYFAPNTWFKERSVTVAWSGDGSTKTFQTEPPKVGVGSFDPQSTDLVVTPLSTAAQASSPCTAYYDPTVGKVVVRFATAPPHGVNNVVVRITAKWMRTL